MEAMLLSFSQRDDDVMFLPILRLLEYDMLGRFTGASMSIQLLGSKE